MKYMFRRHQIETRCMRRTINSVLKENSTNKQCMSRLSKLVRQTMNRRLKISRDSTKTFMHKHIKTNSDKSHSSNNGELHYLDKIKKIKTMRKWSKMNQKRERMLNLTTKSIINKKMRVHTSMRRTVFRNKRTINSMRMTQD